jgi:hypothetical protein
MMEYAGWHPDPSRRHEYRYWDGSAWTDAVADRSLVTVDPLIAGPASQPVGAAPTIASPAGVAWQAPAVTADPAQSHLQTWIVVLALILFFPIGLVLVWRSPWREGARIGITVAVAVLVLGGAVASVLTVYEQSKAATTPHAVDRPAPRAAPVSTTLPPAATTLPRAATTRTQAFLHAVHDPRAGSLGTEDDALLLELGVTGCSVRGTLPPGVMASSLHDGTAGVTLAQATYFVASIRLLCPHP